MKKLLVANWKSNKTREQAQKWLDAYEEWLKLFHKKVENWQVVIAPPFPSLMFISNRLLNRQLHEHTFLGVQDFSSYPAGSYTGAVSGVTLEGFNVKYAIVGHSERRKYFHETSQDVAMKVDQALESSITPIVCVDRTEVAEQARLIDDYKKKRIIVAYEPVEFIGSGQAQPVDEVLTVIQEIKAVFGDVPVLYGGSVNPDNIDQFHNQEQIAGYLVGGASLNVESFVSML